MKMSIATKPPGEISLRCSWLTICLLFILIFTFFNGFLNSIYYEYGASHYWECTFLGEPIDLHGDLVKSALALASIPPPGLRDWSPHYQNFYLHNAYVKMGEVYTGKISIFSVTPFALLLLAGLLQGILATGPAFVMTAYYLASWTVLGALCQYFIENLRDRILTFVALALSYPFMVMLTRGNIGAAVTGIMLIPYVYLACSKRLLPVAAICLAVACNIRPNAILLAPLFLCFGLRRSIIGAVLFLIIGAAIGGISYLTAVHAFPGYSLQIFFQALQNYTVLYVIEFHGNGNNSSAYGMIKLLDSMFLTHLTPQILLATIQVISGIGIILIGLTSYKFWRGRLPVWHFAFAIVCIYILASTILATYHLLILFVFILAAGGKHPESGSFPNFVLFMSALVLIPKNYFFFYPEISCELILNPLILIFAVGWILLSKYPAQVETSAPSRVAEQT